MVAGKSGVKCLGLVVIVTAMLLCRVAEADGTCYFVCYTGCISPWYCKINPACLAGCAVKCAADCLGATTGKDNDGLLPNIGELEQPNANRYCKLGCESSVCSAITNTLTLLSSAEHLGEEVVKESVERCNNACSKVCTKRFSAPMVTA